MGLIVPDSAQLDAVFMRHPRGDLPQVLDDQVTDVLTQGTVILFRLVVQREVGLGVYPNTEIVVARGFHAATSEGGGRR